MTDYVQQLLSKGFRKLWSQPLYTHLVWGRSICNNYPMEYVSLVSNDEYFFIYGNELSGVPDLESVDKLILQLHANRDTIS